MAGAKQRQPWHLAGERQGQFDPRRAATENRHGLRRGLPLLPALEKLREGFDRQQLHGVALLRRCRNLRADIERQPAGIQGAAIDQLHLLLGGGQACHRTDDQLDLGRPTQRLQLDLTILRPMPPGQQPRQHPRIPGRRPCAEQGNAPRRPLQQGPAPQYTKVRVAGTDQQQVIVMRHAELPWLHVQGCNHGKAMSS